MENASKALIIAASLIISLFILFIMIYVFRQGARVNQAYDQKQITNQLELYNSRFEEFDRDNNNIIDVISLANLAYDTNSICDFDPMLAVKIEIKIGTNIFTIPKTKDISGRNKILTPSNHEISIYNLADLTLGELVPTYATMGAQANSTDKLSTTKLDENNSTISTIYKYLFKVENSGGFKYYEHNSKVSQITLTAYINPEW